MSGKDENSIPEHEIPLTDEEIEAFGLEEAPDDAGPSWNEITNTRKEGANNG